MKSCDWISLPSALLMGMIFAQSLSAPHVLAQSKENPWVEGDGYCSNAQVNQVCSQALDQASATAACVSRCQNEQTQNPAIVVADCNEQCKTAVLAEKNQILEKCLAVEFASETNFSQELSIGLQTVVAVTCGIACGATAFDAASGGSWQTACQWVNFAASAADNAYSYLLKQDYEQKASFLSDVLMPVGIQVGGSVVSSWMMSADEKPVPKQDPSFVGPPAPNQAPTKTSSLKDKALACVPFAMAGYLIYQKHDALSGNAATVKQACSDVEQTLGAAMSAVQTLGSAAKKDSPLTPIDVAGGAPKVAAPEDQKAGGASAGIDPVADAFSSPEKLGRTLSALAEKAPPGKDGKKPKAPSQQDLSDLFAALNKVGVSPAALAQDGVARGGTAAIQSGISKAGVVTVEEMDQLKGVMSQVQTHRSKLDSVYAAAGGGGSKGKGTGAVAGKRNPFADLFGQGASGPTAQGGTQNFDPLARPIPQAFTQEDEIFHVGYPGTIFDIITEKVSVTRDRIDQMEWDTRMNRALQGLPPKDAALPARKVSE